MGSFERVLYPYKSYMFYVLSQNYQRFLEKKYIRDSTFTSLFCILSHFKGGVSKASYF